MKRTLYIDGVEVDASDLNNTEDSKVDEVLLTRRVTAHYGVVDGLGCTNSANRIVIDTGRLLFRNGEVGILDTPIVGITGASFEAGVSSFVGLRLTEVTSNPKPHEVDPTIFDTRASAILNAELFVATDNTDAARTKALNAAIDAELNDGNYVLLAEFSGTGSGLSAALQTTPAPRTKGGDDPFRDNPKTKDQKRGLVSVYLHPTNDQFPIESAEDHFHRSLIGSGNPEPRNAHGLTLADIHGDAILDQVITKHQGDFHANGVVGMEPPEDDFTTTMTGSFAWGTDSFGTVTVHDLVNTGDGAATNEFLVIQGKERKKGQITTIPDGVIAPKISFAGRPAGLYYIVCRWGSNESGGQPVFGSSGKTINAGDFAFTSGFDSICVTNDGKRVWVNNAIDPADSERKFYVLGLVQWDGASTFTNLNSNATITIPSTNGDLVFKNSLSAGHPLFIPASVKTLDLRRFGDVTNENVQRRTLRLDRLAQVVISEDDFIAHAGIRIIGGTPVVVNGQGLHAVPGSNNTLLKHLTDFDAFDLFGHRQRLGTAQHGLATHDGALGGNFAPVDEDAAFSGFQASRDKWKQDNLTMTIFKWADLQDVQGGATQRSIGDAAAVSGGNPDTGVAGGYGVVRRGILKNFCITLRTRPASGTHTLDVFVLYGPTGTLDGTFAGSISKTQVGTSIGVGADDFFRFVPEPIVGGVPIAGTPADPWLIKISREKSDANTGWHDLTVTAEFHYTS
jgi:hypothetical protein